MAVIQRVNGVMVTMTTYGTWLRGDARGWVEDGRTYPADPVLQVRDAARMRYPPFCFAAEELVMIGDMIGRALIERLSQRVLALAVRTWHAHLVVADSDVTIDRIVRCAKEAVRYGLRRGRPIWTTGYNKRFCFGLESLQTRIAYVERHNLELGWPARPWPFILALDE